MTRSRGLKEKFRRPQQLKQNNQEDYANRGGLLEGYSKMAESLQGYKPPATEARRELGVEERQCYRIEWPRLLWGKVGKRGTMAGLETNAVFRGCNFND